MNIGSGSIVLESPRLFGAYPRLATLAAMSSAHHSPHFDAGRRDIDGPTRQRSILLVDDEALVVNVGQYILEDAGYKVVTASSGEEALDIYGRRGDEIDLVILDFVMPGINGYETWVKLAEMDPKVRVLFWSGYLADQEVSKLVAHSACDFIAKPYQIPDLLRKIRRLLEAEPD